MLISDWSSDVCSSDLKASAAAIRSECLASRSGPLDPAQTILIPNHLTQHPLPSLKTDEGRFVSVFENSRGQQLILIVDKTTKTGQFSAGEAGWRIENISSDKIMPNYFFDQSELAWYTACWMAILKMSMDQVASLRRPGAKPLLQTGPYSVSEDLIRKAKSGSPDTPEFGSRTDPASNLQLKIGRAHV